MEALNYYNKSATGPIACKTMDLRENNNMKLRVEGESSLNPGSSALEM